MEHTLKTLAREAKQRLKKGFWQDCEQRLQSERTHAREQGINQSKLEIYFRDKVDAEIRGVVPDEFYLKVKKLLLEEGEVSDAIGRLTDREYYSSLSYAERQRYSLELSARYLKALERFRREYEYEIKGRK